LTMEVDNTMQPERRKTDVDLMSSALLPCLPVDLIRACYAAAAGNEIASGKFASPESSAALAANTFGPFLLRPADMPPLPDSEAWGWPALSVCLEAVVRFPWSGGRHPCLDALIETNTGLIGVESKRYQPFRMKPPGSFLLPPTGARSGARGCMDMWACATAFVTAAALS
jgi:hypothetical protein